MTNLNYNENTNIIKNDYKILFQNKFKMVKKPAKLVVQNEKLRYGLIKLRKLVQL